jgi:8-oxo-dGTP diphosphatase
MTPEHLKINNIDWQTWQPEQVATLMFVTRSGTAEEEVLLIRKKRGLGAGKINGPGGRIEAAETPLQCAVRETEEELCITPQNIRYAGELFFHAEDMPRIHAYVYVAKSFIGTPTETDEAIPLWTPVKSIPFDEMWEDDRLWLDAVLANQTVKGWFSFVEESLLDYRLELTPGQGDYD